MKAKKISIKIKEKERIIKIITIKFQIAKKINYNDNYSKSTNIAGNVVSDNKICLTPFPKSNFNNIDLENILSAKEKEHYNLVQRIMSAGPKVSKNNKIDKTTRIHKYYQYD